MPIIADARKSITNPLEIEQLLTDDNGLNRWAAAQNPNFIPTPAQLRRGLNDPSPNVCAVFATRFPLSKDDVAHCVASPHAGVRLAILTKEDVVVDEAQWLSLLFDKDPTVIDAAFKLMPLKNQFPDFLPSKEIIDRGLEQGVEVQTWFEKMAKKWTAEHEAKKLKARVGVQLESQPSLAL